MDAKKERISTERKEEPCGDFHFPEMRESGAYPTEADTAKVLALKAMGI
jgi:hypothetical protein